MNSTATPAASYPTRAVQVLVTVLIAWVVMLILSAASTQNLLFDGAMNLEVSRSIAEGTGPRRLYDFNDYFPHSVQTKEPYILVGALVFKIFGVGTFQAQLPNLLFLLFVCMVLLLVTRRLFDTTTALVVVLVFLTTPMMTQYGLSGYGELPSFAFGLAAIALLASTGPASRYSTLKCLAAGVLAGLAFTTKTVGAIQVGAIGLTLLYRSTADCATPWRHVFRRVPAFIVGLIIPVLLVEAWRWQWLGTVGYLDWWSTEATGILYQAGVKSAPNVAQGVQHAPLLEKIQTHFGMLASELRRSNTALLGIIFLPLIFAVGFIADRTRSGEAKTWIFGLALISICYVAWWMGITPTEKAWLRRFYIGLLCLSIIGATAMVNSAKMMLTNSAAKKRVLHGLVFIVLLTLYLPVGLPADRLQLVPSFKPSQALADTLAASRYVAKLDEDSAIFASGWYSAPTIALQSGRQFIDLSDWPIGKYPGRKTYLVADEATFATGALSRVLARYPHKAELSPSSFAQVYQIDFSRPLNAFTPADRAKALPSVEFSGKPYSPTYGMQGYNPGVGGRWIESDSEILLRYEGQSTLGFFAYMALPELYRNSDPLSGRVLVPGCPAMPFAFTGTGWQDFNFQLTQCKLTPSSVMRVRILLNNTADLPHVYDLQMAMLLGTIGFYEPALQPAPAPSESHRQGSS